MGSRLNITSEDIDLSTGLITCTVHATDDSLILQMLRLYCLSTQFMPIPDFFRSASSSLDQI